MVEIFLRKKYNPNIIFEESITIKKIDYEKVAEINSCKLDGIYNLCQNVNTSWIRNKEIKAISQEKNCRSSSIGDIFSLDGILHIILPFGFKAINWNDSLTLAPDFSEKPEMQSTSPETVFLLIDNHQIEVEILLDKSSNLMYVKEISNSYGFYPSDNGFVDELIRKFRFDFNLPNLRILFKDVSGHYSLLFAHKWKETSNVLRIREDWIEQQEGEDLAKIFQA